MVQPLWRAVWRFLKKLKIELPYDPEIPLLGIYPEKTIVQKDTCIWCSFTYLFYIKYLIILPLIDILTLKTNATLSHSSDRVEC